MLHTRCGAPDLRSAIMTSRLAREEKAGRLAREEKATAKSRNINPALPFRGGGGGRTHPKRGP